MVTSCYYDVQSYFCAFDGMAGCSQMMYTIMGKLYYCSLQIILSRSPSICHKCCMSWHEAPAGVFHDVAANTSSPLHNLLLGEFPFNTGLFRVNVPNPGHVCIILSNIYV